MENNLREKGKKFNNFKIYYQILVCVETGEYIEHITVITRWREDMDFIFEW